MYGMSPIPPTLEMVGTNQIGLDTSSAIPVAGAIIQFTVGFTLLRIQSPEFGYMTELLVGYTPPNPFFPFFIRTLQETGYSTYQLSMRRNFGVMKTLLPFRFERIRLFKLV